MLVSFASDPEDEGDTASFQRAKECSLEMLKVIKETSSDLDLHGGLAASATLQRLHVKELRGSSPRSNSARQKMKKAEQVTMSRAEFERSKQRWFLIAGRPIKIAAGIPFPSENLLYNRVFDIPELFLMRATNNLVQIKRDGEQYATYEYTYYGDLPIAYARNEEPARELLYELKQK